MKIREMICCLMGSFHSAPPLLSVYSLFLSLVVNILHQTVASVEAVTLVTGKGKLPQEGYVAVFCFTMHAHPLHVFSLAWWEFLVLSARR